MQNVHDLLAGWGEKVAEEREALGLSQRDLADRCAVHVTTIWRVEAGKVNPNDELKWKIAGALGMRMDVLWAWPRIVPPCPQEAA